MNKCKIGSTTMEPCEDQSAAAPLAYHIDAEKIDNWDDLKLLFSCLKYIVWTDDPQFPKLQHLIGEVCHD